jgi:hypothetical protein
MRRCVTARCLTHKTAPAVASSRRADINDNVIGIGICGDFFALSNCSDDASGTPLVSSWKALENNGVLRDRVIALVQSHRTKCVHSTAQIKTFDASSIHATNVIALDLLSLYCGLPCHLAGQCGVDVVGPSQVAAQLATSAIDGYSALGRVIASRYGESHSGRWVDDIGARRLFDVDDTVALRKALSQRAIILQRQRRVLMEPMSRAPVSHRDAALAVFHSSRTTSVNSITTASGPSPSLKGVMKSMLRYQMCGRWHGQRYAVLPDGMRRSSSLHHLNTATV